jgi:hypothetical protein
MGQQILKLAITMSTKQSHTTSELIGLHGLMTAGRLCQVAFIYFRDVYYLSV